MKFTEAEAAACDRLIELALREDLGDRGDVTSQAVIPKEMQGCAAFVARSPGVLAGWPAVERVVWSVDADLQLECLKSDGERIVKGDRLATVAGSMRSILAAERTALNFLQHLSGIASLTRRFVDAVAGLPAKILDTRKTLPGWRLLAKYAVRCGGGLNHRMGLYDGILIKDNHLFAMGMKREIDDMDDLHELCQWLKREMEHGGLSQFPIEVEVESLPELKEWLAGKTAIIMLDNMVPELLKKAVSLRNKRAPGVLLEASGGVTLETVRAIAETGVDRISVGAITHSAPALDIALDYENG